MGMPSRRTNNFLESGRGLGHVTPTIFGSTVGYPSDSLASCTLMDSEMAVLEMIGFLFFSNSVFYDILRWLLVSSLSYCDTV